MQIRKPLQKWCGNPAETPATAAPHTCEIRENALTEKEQRKQNCLDVDDLEKTLLPGRHDSLFKCVHETKMVYAVVRSGFPDVG